MAWRVGVDIGGTFTDVALVDEATGEIGVAKVPTTPRNLAEGVLAALGIALDRYAVEGSKVGLLAHATTVVTNAILEGRGARAALITTRGFRDVLELRRSARADLYDLFQDAPATLIPRRRRFEITERVGADGNIVTALAENEIDGLIEALKAARRAQRSRAGSSRSAHTARHTDFGDTPSVRASTTVRPSSSLSTCCSAHERAYAGPSDCSIRAQNSVCRTIVTRLGGPVPVPV